MWDDEHEKKQQRNSFIMMVLMMVVLGIWIQFFADFQAPPPAETTGEAQTESASGQLPVETAESQAVTAPPEAGWPFLPPVAEQTDPAEDEFALRDEELELKFTAIGARLKSAQVLDTKGEDVQLVPAPEVAEGVSDADVVYPLGLNFTEAAIGNELDRRRWDVLERNVERIVFGITLPNVAEITKSFTLTDTPHVLDLEVSYKNLEPETRNLGLDHTPAYMVAWGPDVASDDLKKGVAQQFVWRINGQNEILKTANLEPSDDGSPHNQLIGNPTGNPEWLAVRSAYFVVGFKPEYEGTRGWIWGLPQFYQFGMAVPSTKLPPGETYTANFKLYAGPSNQQALAAAWPTLETSLRFFEWFAFMDVFAKFLLSMLNWFYGIVPNYGLAIILLTCVVRVVMLPLTLKQMRSMKQMQLLAPEMEELRTKYKDDPQEQSRKMMEMYRERGVNPLGGCFPVLLQMPIFIALYRMLWSAYELRGAPFGLWIIDLSEPDRLFEIPGMVHIPFLGEYLQYVNVLPILSAGAMIVSMKMMPMTGPMQNPQQKMIMNIMPVFFSAICYNFASGLNLYILVSTVLGIAQNKLVNVGEVKLPEKKPLQKKKNMYAAAQARKKRVTKELKAAKKRNGPTPKGTRPADTKGTPKE